MDATVTTPQAIATVLSVQGQGFARNPAGAMRALQAGDVLLEGDTIVTMPGGQVQLAFLDGQLLNVLPNETFKLGAEVSANTRPSVGEAALASTDVDRVIQALERGGDINDELDPTAAGLDGGSNNSGNTFVRLMRVAEGIDAFSFQGASQPAAIEFTTFEEGRSTDTAALTAVAAPATISNTTVSLSATPAVAEGGNIIYTVNLSTPPSTPMSVTLSNGAVIVVAAGASSGSTSVAAPTDDVYIDAGNISATIVSTSGGGVVTTINPTPASTSITDTLDATTITLSASAASVTEGGSIVYTATLNNSVTATPLVITLNNGATITIPVGSSSASSGAVAVRADDVYVQGTQSISASISGTTGGNFEALTTTSTVSTNVVDDSDTTLLSLSGDASIIEGVSANYTLSLTSPTQTAITVALTYSGTAINGTDFTGVASVTIAAGSSSTSFSLSTFDDVIAEGAENFKVTVGAITGTGGFETLAVNGAANAVTTTIIDNDGVPTIASVSSASATEATSIVHTVTLSNASSVATTYALSLVDGSATGAGTDYTSTLTNAAFSNGVTISGGTISVPAGVTSFSVTVPTTSDVLAEANETYTLNVGAASGTGTINDDDGTPSFSIANASISEGGLMTFTVTRTGDAQAAQTADYGTSIGGGDSAAVGDFTAASGNVSFAAGETSKTFTVQTTADAVFEANETFTVTLTNATGGAVIGTATATGTIINVNNAPTAVADTATAVEAGGVSNGTPGTNPIGNVLTNDTDPDTGDTKAVTAFSFGAANGTLGSSLTANYGTLTLNADGSYNYVLNNNNATVQALNVGQTLTETFNYTMQDATGATSSTTLTVTIDGANDAPVNTVSVAQSTNEDTARVFSTANGNAISVADVDGGTLTTTVSVTNGTLTAVAFAGAAITSNGTASVTISGTAAAINGALDGLSYANTADYNGSATLTVLTSDGSLSDSDTIAITVIPVTDILADTATTAEDNAVTLDVLGNDTFENAGRTITAVNGSAITDGGAAIAVTNGSVALVGGQLVFTPTANFNGVPTFTYTVTSGGVTETVKVDVNVTAVNDLPTGTDNTFTTNEDTPYTFSAASFGYSDVEGSALASVRIDTLPAAGTLLLSGVPVTAGQVITAANLGNLTFAPAANGNGTNYASFTFSVNDGTGFDAAPNTITMDVTAVNDAPVNTVPAAQTTAEDTPTAITGLSISDGDAGGSSMTVTLAVTNGTLNVSGGSAAISGSGTNSVTLTGTAAAINATLAATVSYVPTANFNGAATLTMTTSDNGNTGSGGTLTDVDTVNITVTAVNDLPTGTDNTFTTNEDTPYTFSSASFGYSDVEGSPLASVRIDTLPAAGTLLLSGVPVTAGQVITAANLGNLTFAPAANANGASYASFTFSVNDGTGFDTAPNTITMNVTAVNDAPVVGTGSATVSEEGLSGANADTAGTSDTTNVVTANGTISITDLDNASFTVTLTAPVTALTSNGTTIVWTGSGTNTLVGTAASNTILTATINNTGGYTVTLSGPVDHATAGAEDLKIFGIGVNVSDGAASTTSTITVNVEDDSPILGTPNNAIISQSIGATLQGNLNLALGADSGSSSRVIFTGAVDGTGHATATLYNAAGTSLGSTYLTYNNSKLVYVSSSDGSLTARDVATNTAIFTVAGNTANGTYKVTMLQTLDDPSYTTSTFSNISGGNGGVFTISDGQNVFNMNLTGYNSNGSVSTVNTSANSIGVGAGQSIDNGEYLRIEFNSSTGSNAPMTGITVTALNLNTGESMNWFAFNSAGGLITSGTLAGTAGGSPQLTIDSTTLGGQSLDTIVYQAGATTGFKLQINSISGQAEVLNQISTYQVQGVDADGDTTAVQSMNLLFDTSSPLTGTTVADALGGSTLNDTLTGGDGNDTLWGGAGNDILTGGLGSDTFKWGLADKGTTATPASDQITDFNTASASLGGDILDLRDLLAGESHTGTLPGNLDDYLHFEKIGSDTVVHVSTSGGFAAGYVSTAQDQVITLSGVDLVTGFANDNAIITDLLTKNKLITD